MSRESKDLRDFSLSIVPGASIWPPDAIRAIVERAADVIDELDAHLGALASLAHVEGHSCKRPEFPCEVCDAVEFAEAREALDAGRRSC